MNPKSTQTATTLSQMPLTPVEFRALSVYVRLLVRTCKVNTPKVWYGALAGEK